MGTLKRPWLDGKGRRVVNNREVYDTERRLVKTSCAIHFNRVSLSILEIHRPSPLLLVKGPDMFSLWRAWMSIRDGPGKGRFSAPANAGGTEHTRPAQDSDRPAESVEARWEG